VNGRIKTTVRSWVKLAQGERLPEPPNGGVIVAEVLHGVIARDPESYLAVNPDWTPTLPSREGTFRLTDILVPVE